MAPAWSEHLPAGLDASSLDLTAGQNLIAVAASHWRREPARPVLQDLDGTWISGEQLAGETSEHARRLGAAGLIPGDRVVLCAGTSAALVGAYLAVLRAGLVAVPVNPSYTRPEVQRLVAAARPAAALVEDDEVGNWITETAGPDLKVWGLGGPVSGAGSRTDHPVDAAGGPDPALLLFTSGTTGTPKGALLSHGNLLSSARAVGLAWRWTEDDRLLLVLPLFHMHGLGVGINGSLVSGGQVVLRPGFDASDVADRCRSGGVSMFFGVPAIYQRLLAAGRAERLSELRLIVSGSAPLAVAQSDALADVCGQRPLERYGMTETVMLTSNPLAGPRKPGRVGLPLPGVELRLAAGGEVQVRGPNVLAGYDSPDGPSRPEDAFTRDGWFRTGDLGELDDDGHLGLVGRSKELIITGGFNVYPREVEEALAEFPGVREAAVVGRPSPDWGEAVTAVVVTDGPVDPADLRNFAAQRLAPYKVPKAVEFVDQLPRNSLGKVLRHEL
ncbi:MAG TPA: AMP-binding protein [Solirubrobacteraceae bacterium]|jgi:malonyl-CoA/methylmalonyl-CoA synthetase|nr:AMP-binding protein [Solirubrobacteraceae bacterium]